MSSLNTIITYLDSLMAGDMNYTQGNTSDGRFVWYYSREIIRGLVG